MSAELFSRLDQIIAQFDDGLRTLFAPAPRAERENPAQGVAAVDLVDAERQLSARLMRVNHAGEVCAQALYRGQAATAQTPGVRQKLAQSAAEENDHLAWTGARINELGSHTSCLNPIWYGGSLMIGALAGLAGDKWSLGFVAETERQVVAHLNGHLARLPARDQASRAVLEQMCKDEGHHATVAIEAGAAPLPTPARRLMRLAAKIMTRTAYWI
ncbi:MAG: 2-polyprenyl-3-methyl-6-methoxy-1,4-benzoquinone monooxygenase [Gammaproteobacteria bacterium]|jgi:ubiquinone biosynthesis monooxygenase Coq7|nr:2-polyprenyl-3-methyl-6-methoxy-1,4-benzoquinone monooxygenase [Gammaproteobacteria bacterium]